VQPFAQLSAVAAPIDLPNVDTDRIIPARYLRKPRETPGYADFLFHDVRYDGERLRPEFVLNQPAFRAAKILVTAENFGCGSSREAAVWALDAAGIRAIIAPSLGDIFHQNCFKVGLLPVILPADGASSLRGQLHANPGTTLAVDLQAQTVTAPDGTVHRFDIDPFRKQMLLSGQDETGLTLGYEAQIREFERRHQAAMPWLAPASPAR
jgi:3-isopropylmalate/(R)-2-methylmalate dehydratase small subunit